MATTPNEMPATPSAEAWAFLARVTKERRDFIGLSQEDLVTYGGPGKSTVSKIERGAQASYSARKIQQLEVALGWKRGTVRSILECADADYSPELLESAAVDYIEEDVPDLTINDRAATSATELSDDELLAELTYRMKRYSALQKGGTGDGTTPDEKIDHRSGVPEMEAEELDLTQPQDGETYS